MSTELPRELGSWTDSFVLLVPANTPNTPTEVTKNAPFDGRIKVIVLHFPAGSQAFAAIRFRIEGQQVFPAREGETIALDDTTLAYAVDIQIKRGDRITMSGTNSDTVSHTIRAPVTYFSDEVLKPHLPVFPPIRAGVRR